MASASAPPPIDPRGPRFNQAAIALLLVAGFLADLPLVIPAVAVVLFLGAAFGPRWGPFLRLYAEVVKPRIRPPAELEDPRPPRFAASLGAAVLTAATIALIAGRPGLGWSLALLVAVLAGLSASTGLCVGCEMYLFTSRRHLALIDHPRVPQRLTEGSERTWVLFTTPYCASCGPAEERLRQADPSARIVRVDATEQPQLAKAFSVRRAPTAVLADRDGDVQARLVGAEAVAQWAVANA